MSSILSGPALAPVRTGLMSEAQRRLDAQQPYMSSSTAPAPGPAADPETMRQRALARGGQRPTVLSSAMSGAGNPYSGAKLG